MQWLTPQSSHDVMGMMLLSRHPATGQVFLGCCFERATAATAALRSSADTLSIVSFPVQACEAVLLCSLQ
jgi:hypothetical protein